MKHLMRYKSKIDGKSRTEFCSTLNTLINFLSKINFYTDEPETVDIKSIKKSY